MPADESSITGEFMANRRLLSVALVAVAVASIGAACGGDGGAEGSETFAHGSSTEEYCNVLKATNPQLTHDLAVAQPDTVQPTISAISDLTAVAPEEIKGDLALIRGYLQLVIDANAAGSTVAPEELTAAGAALDEVSARVARSIEETCGVALE